jgi:hypothetical protein
MASNEGEQTVVITALLKRLWPSPSAADVTAVEIAAAISHIFTNSLSPVQTGALLTALHFTGMDRESEVLAKCAQAMRQAAAQIDHQELREIVQKRGKKEGAYAGGLVSSTSPFNVTNSNISSVILSAQEVTHTTHSISAPPHR